MTKINFFHQCRKDGAIRTGVEVGEELVLHSFIPTKKPDDPVLLWFIDLRFTTRDLLEAEPEVARSFLIDLATPTGRALRSCADEVRAGVDPDIWPGSYKIKALPNGVTGEIVFSATKRLTLAELSRAMVDLGENWTAILKRLETSVAPAY